MRYTTTVRGDSIRDLYAKGLALVGLGVLAGAGALVDYWPTGTLLPAAASIARPEAIATAMPVPATPVVARPVARIYKSPLRPVAFVAPTPVLVLDVWPVADPIGESVSLLMPPRDLEPAAVAVLASAAPAMATASPDLFVLPDTPPSVSEPTAWAGEADTDSFLTGAVKRTGATILHTSAKAGASIFDAFRTIGGSLGGAVRRVLPD